MRRERYLLFQQPLWEFYSSLIIEIIEYVDKTPDFEPKPYLISVPFKSGEKFISDKGFLGKRQYYMIILPCISI